MSSEIGKAKQSKPTFTNTVKERLEKAASRIREVKGNIAQRNQYIFGSNIPEELKRDDLAGSEASQIQDLLSGLEADIGTLEDVTGPYLHEL